MEIDLEVIWERSHMQAVEVFIACEGGDLDWTIFKQYNDAHNTLSDLMYEDNEEDKYNQRLSSGQSLWNDYVDVFTKYYTKHLDFFIPDDNDNALYAQNTARGCGCDIPSNIEVRQDILHSALNRISYADANRLMMIRLMNS